MKTRNILFASLLLLTPYAANAESYYEAPLPGVGKAADNSCCEQPADDPAMVDDSCCAEMPAGGGVAMPEESIYNFNAVFTDDNGKSRELADFAGRPVVLTMFFASCGYACPMLAHDMLKVQDTLSPQVREQAQFVMVSFDPERDTVEKLQEFRDQVGAGAHWTLMRGEVGDVRTLAMLLGVQFRREPSGDFSHSNLITVLDANGVIAHRREGLQGGLPGVSEALVRLATDK